MDQYVEICDDNPNSQTYPFFIILRKLRLTEPAAGIAHWSPDTSVASVLLQRAAGRRVRELASNVARQLVECASSAEIAKEHIH